MSTQLELRTIRHQAAICRWLDANDIPHAEVPFDARPTITDGTVTIDVQRRGPNGKPYLDGPGPGAKLARRSITRPLKQPLPAELAWWAL